MSPNRNRGELEAHILCILWDASGPLTAKEVQERFEENVPAITTLITVLDRMRIKGDVQKFSSGGRSNTFSASKSRIEHTTTAMTAALAESPDTAAALMHFAGSLSEEDRDFLRIAISQNQK